MALPALVLIHGAQHGGDCWDLTVAEARRMEPRLRVLAVDLPGRRNKPGDLLAARIGDWVDSVVADVDDAGLDSVVVVGHSLAGTVLPGVVTKLGAARVREMVFAAAFVPPDGRAVVDALPGALGWYARRNAQRFAQLGVPGTLPTRWAMLAFCNGMTRSQRQFAAARFYPESPSIVLENVDRSAMPEDIPRTWIVARRDRALSVKTQRRCIAALGGVQTVVSIDTCHDLMISQPRRLAEVLVGRCRRYGQPE